MTHIRFQSLTRGNDVGYLYDDSISADHSWSRNPPEYCHTKLMQYKTYGDGLTVHSSPYSVPIEYVSDLCVSMTHHFINHPDDLTDAVNNYLFTDHLSADAILFATKIKYIEGKIRYYSMQEQKISASEKLRYDKRYERIPEWADGSAGSVYRLTVESYFCGIRRILLMDKIHTVMEYPWMDYKKLYPQLPIDDDMRDFHSIKRALMVLVRLVRAEREKMDAMDDAERYTQHYIAKHAETETIAA